VEHGPGWQLLATGLIRSVLHIDPDTLTDEEWAIQVRVAETLQNIYIRKMWKPFSG
jgi:hypothetical protein